MKSIINCFINIYNNFEKFRIVFFLEIVLLIWAVIYIFVPKLTQ